MRYSVSARQRRVRQLPRLCLCVCVCVSADACVCERVRVWVCAVASKRGRALNGEMGEVRGRLCASAQVRDALCAKSIVSQNSHRMRLRVRDRKLQFAQAQLQLGGGTRVWNAQNKGFCLKDKSWLGLNSNTTIFDNTEIAMCACICSCGDAKGSQRERERDREIVHAQSYLINQQKN